ncbi:uncharacterized protein LOC124898609 [Capsicum annuum]|uniref:uncharacterized protein LOC124898609 n=1 Tax=Capsicum annuum TaxID=4072 RepID=UPI001FB08E72|nr:uncharacterized protein LOC124898609 [Capsicum annuum]
MVSSLSPDIIPFVMDAKISYALWQNLATTYAKPSRARIMSLREDLNTIQKENLSITVYLQKIKEIYAKLSSVSVYISVDEVFLHAVPNLVVLLATSTDLVISAPNPTLLHNSPTRIQIVLSTLAGDYDDCSSTIGYVVFFSCHLVSWSSKKQRAVARSLTEKEYRAIFSTTAELCWVHNLLKELSITPAPPPVIYCDNLGATYVCANSVFHSHIKHLELDYHFIRKLVQ